MTYHWDFPVGPVGFRSGSDSKASIHNVGTQVQSLGWEDPLEKGMATHSSILAWETPWTEEPGELQSMRSQRVGYDWATERIISSFPS